MVAYEERWAFKLAANLSGRTQQAYSSMNAADVGSYRKLLSCNDMILQKRAIANAFELARGRRASRIGSW